MIQAPYRILAVVLLWLASLVAVGMWQRHDGAASIEAKWQKREAAQQAQAATQIKALQEKTRTDEQKNAAAMAAIAADYERKFHDAQTQRAADLAALRAGSLRLRDPAAALVPACSGATAETGAGAGGRDGGQTGQLPAAPAGLLSGASSEWLIDFASDADDVARQLASCQQIVIEDRNSR